MKREAMEDTCLAVDSLAKKLEVAVGKELRCCICLSYLTDPTMLPCNHAMCGDCVDSALKHSQRCPLCNLEIHNARMIGRNKWVLRIVNAYRDCLDELGLNLTQHTPVPPGQNNRPKKMDAKRQRPRTDRGGAPQPDCCGMSGSSGSGRKGKSKSRTRPWGAHRGGSGDAPPAPSGAGRGGSSSSVSPSTRSLIPSTGRYSPPLPSTPVASSRSQPVEEPEQQETDPEEVGWGLDVEGGGTRSAFVVGDCVEVFHRTWAGSNKPGGVALIKAVHDGGARYDVKYTVNCRGEKGVEAKFIRPQVFCEDEPRRRSRGVPAVPSMLSLERGNRHGLGQRQGRGKGKGKGKGKGMGQKQEHLERCRDRQERVPYAPANASGGLGCRPGINGTDGTKLPRVLGSGAESINSRGGDELGVHDGSSGGDKGGDKEALREFCHTAGGRVGEGGPGIGGGPPCTSEQGQELTVVAEVTSNARGDGSRDCEKISKAGGGGAEQEGGCLQRDRLVYLPPSVPARNNVEEGDQQSNEANMAVSPNPGREVGHRTHQLGAPEVPVSSLVGLLPPASHPLPPIPHTHLEQGQDALCKHDAALSLVTMSAMSPPPCRGELASLEPLPPPPSEAPASAAQQSHQPCPAERKSLSLPSPSAASCPEPPTVMGKRGEDRQDVELSVMLPGPFAVGDVVDVQERMFPGSNRPGGVARVTHTRPDGTYDVKYILHSATESSLAAGLLSHVQPLGAGVGGHGGWIVDGKGGAGSSQQGHMRPVRTSRLSRPPDAATGLANARCLNDLLGDTQHPDLVIDPDIGLDLDPDVEFESSAGRLGSCSQGHRRRKGVGEGGRTPKIRRLEWGMQIAGIGEQGSGEDEGSEAGVNEGASCPTSGTRKEGASPAREGAGEGEGGGEYQEGNREGGDQEGEGEGGDKGRSSAVQQQGSSPPMHQDDEIIGGGCGEALAWKSGVKSATEANRVTEHKRSGVGRGEREEPAERVRLTHETRGATRGATRGRSAARGRRPGAWGRGGKRNARIPGHVVKGGMVLTLSSATPKTLAVARKMASSFGCELVDKYQEKVTHVVCTVKPNTKLIKIRSIKYLRGVASGKWVITPAWLQACLSRGYLVEEDQYELTGDLKSQVPDAPRRSRLSCIDENRAGLFSGMSFCLYGAFGTHCPPRVDLVPMLQAQGGRVVNKLEELAIASAVQDGNQRAVIIFQETTPEETAHLGRTLSDLFTDWGETRLAVVQPSWVVESVGCFRPLSLTAEHAVLLGQAASSVL